MCADCRESIKSIRIANDPYAIIVLVLLTYLANEIIVRKTGFERRWWFIKNTGKHHAQRANARGRNKYKKCAPPCYPHKIAPVDTPNTGIFHRWFVLLGFLNC